MRLLRRWKVKIKIKDIGGALMVLIQLGTVWILWLTYKNTVIPTRQKELLSEQLAQLEMTRSKTISQIGAMKEHLMKLTRQSEEQVSEVKQLQKDKLKLASEIASVRKEESRATNAARGARETLSDTRRQLMLAQLDIFHERALFAVYRPNLNDRVNEINGSSATRQETVADEIESARRAWPTFDLASKEIVTQLADLKSPLFPDSFGVGLSSLFEKSMAGFSCKIPDFDSLKHKYAQRLKMADANAEKEVEKQEAKIIEDGKREGIRYVIDPKNHQVSFSAQNAANKIGVQYSLDMKLFDLRAACFKSYTDKGVKILDGYVKDLRHGEASSPIRASWK